MKTFLPFGSCLKYFLAGTLAEAVELVFVAFLAAAFFGGIFCLREKLFLLQNKR
jgi:hypothetical protein